jgi:YD repeat-containing protein
VKEKSIGYILENTKKKIKGVKLYNIMNSANTEVRFYDMYSEWWHPGSSTETVYDINGENPVTTTTHYDYENPFHKNLTKTTTVDSKGKTIITTNQYPHDLPSGIDGTTPTIISSMVADHVIDPVIKSHTTVNGEVIKGSINNYTVETHTDGNNVSNNMYLPLNVKTLKIGTTSEFENRLEFAEYDNNGHILQVQKPDGTPVSYIWGYNNEYPIAKIENATYSQVSSQVANLQGLSNLDDDHCLDTETCDENNLRSALNILRNTLPNAMVTTYTYDPLIGVTSMTDPKGYTVYYEYDDFNRLEQVVDADGYILSENEYNYKQ